MDDLPPFTLLAKAGVSCKNGYLPEVTHRRQYAEVAGRRHWARLQLGVAAAAIVVVEPY